ncbi:peptide ABC transporter substrate-binding protein [Aurantivibrio plasticivorans]
MKKIHRLCLIMFSVLLSFSAVDVARAEDKTLTIGISQFPATLHPNIESMVAKSYVLAMAQRQLTTIDANWDMTCLFCETLPTLENGLAVLEETPDGKPGMAMTFTLPKNAKWADGVPVTTKDVEFAWQVGRNPEVGINNMELYRRMYQLDIKDDKTFTFHLDKRTYDYNRINDIYLLPAHLERKIFENDPREYKNRTKYDSDSTNPGLYQGPYRVTNIVRGSSITLERNQYWHGKAPYFDKIIVRTIENTAALEANLLSGNIDMIAGELGVTLDQAIAFKKRHGKKFEIVYKPGLIYEHIDLNLDNPILKDKRVRQALLYAIDRELISQQLFNGIQPVAHGDISPLDKVYSPDIKRYPFDVNKAKSLLEEAGWDIIKKGVRHNANGDALRLELNTTAGNKTRELVQQVLQSQWKQVGVDIRIRNEPPRVFFGQTTRERKFGSMVMYAWMSSPENPPRPQLHSTEIPSEANNYSGQNYTGFRNSEMDELLAALEEELDFEKRTPLWKRMQDIYVEELPALPLYFRANPHIWPKWLKGIVPTGHQYPSTEAIEYWRRAE